MPIMSSLMPDASKPVLVLPHFSADRKSHTFCPHFVSSMQSFSSVAARHFLPVPLIGLRWPDFYRNVSRFLRINSDSSNHFLCWRFRIQKFLRVKETAGYFPLARSKCARRFWKNVSRTFGA